MEDQRYYQLLLRSLEETLPPEEAQELANALETSPELRQEKQKLMAMRKLLQHQDFQFEPFLAAKVMNQLQASDPKMANGWLFQMGFAFQRVGVPAFAIVLLLLLLTFGIEQSVSLDVILGTSEVTVDDLMTGVITSF